MISKAIRFLALFFLLQLNLQALEIEKFVDIDENFISSTGSGKIYYIKDTNNSLNPTQVLHSKTLKLASKNHLGGTTGPFWSKINLKNSSDKIQNLSLFNPLAGTNAIDLYIYKDKKLIHTHTLGDLRPQNSREVVSRYAMFTLTLLPQERVTIISKIQNYYIYNIAWHIQTSSHFLEVENSKIFALAFFGGLVSIFSLFAFLLFTIYKQKEYLIISLYFFTSLIYEYGFNGALYQLNLGLNLSLITALTWNSILISYILLTLFAYYFFDFKNTYPRLAIFAKLLISILMLEFGVTLYAQFVDETLFYLYSLFEYMALIVPLSLTIIGFYMLIKKEVGAKYYLTGHGILLFSIILNTLGIFNIITYHEEFKVILPLSIMIDALFLLFAQYIRTRQGYCELSKHKELLLEQSRFISIGQAIGNITHQWKQPLSNIGSTVTLLEATFKHNPSYLERAFQNKLPNLQKNIDQMQHTIDDFSDYYATKKAQEKFFPNIVLKKYVLEILKSKIILKNVTINFNIKEDLQLECYEHIFSSVMVILIDNSLDSFTSISLDNQITISIYKTKNYYKIDYTDNAGGIKIEPIESIFEYFVSSKENGDKKGHGMGLAIAKILVEERLDGKISVKNKDNGVLFQIFSPVKIS